MFADTDTRTLKTGQHGLKADMHTLKTDMPALQTGAHTLRADTRAMKTDARILKKRRKIVGSITVVRSIVHAGGALRRSRKRCEAPLSDVQ